MTPKQALAKWNEQNPTKPIKFSEGRGRLSREAVAKCTELAAKGWSIAGYIVENKATASASAPVVKKVAQVNEKVIHDIVYVYDEKLYQAIDKTGKAWSMREACNNCRVSLVCCVCDRLGRNPTILGDIVVAIKPRA